MFYEHSNRLVIFLIAAVCFLTACATSTLDRAIAQCSAEGKSPAYTRADGVEKFSCGG